ncbi:TIGR03943 family protein [Treponema sp. OMZ 305]|uniref:TIGR03943 family putative permease subunit n=1 Tax=Treponema TaxID=157 RepID=UPI001BAF4CDF|nr:MULTISPECIES: TIGR03943 family protein [Treponema]QUY18649.1 TIGR03943 family protein [Treponema vincentii]UTC58541.1 TIGR03943 family protein [Treponema sp. OMZ 305]
MKIIKKSTRVQDILQVVILFGFALYCTGVVVSGSAYRYVHERHVPMLLFSAAVFFIIGVLKLKSVMQGLQPHTSFFNSGYAAVFDRFEGGSRSGYAGVFGLAVFAVALAGMVSAAKTGIAFSQFSYADSLGTQYTAAPPAQTALSRIAPPQLPLQDGRIIMDDDTFSLWLTELYTKLDKWVGTEITAVGSVWKDSELFEQHDFALARMMMTCCAADMQPVGLLAQWSGAQELTDGEWVEITGTLSKKPYKAGFDPYIIVASVKKVDPPGREYIYP